MRTHSARYTSESLCLAVDLANRNLQPIIYHATTAIVIAAAVIVVAATMAWSHVWCFALPANVFALALSFGVVLYAAVCDS